MHRENYNKSKELLIKLLSMLRGGIHNICKRGNNIDEQEFIILKDTIRLNIEEIYNIILNIDNRYVNMYREVVPQLYDIVNSLEVSTIEKNTTILKDLCSEIQIIEDLMRI